jgi:hypothetical protein
MELPMYLLEFKATAEMADWMYERKGKELHS